MDHVVDEHVAAGGAQVANVLCEGRLASPGGGESEAGAWGKVMYDFEHRRSLANGFRNAVGRPEVDAVLAGQDLDAPRQVSRGLDIGQVVDAVRQHADFRAGPVRTQVGAREVRHVRDVALGDVCLAGNGQRGRPDGRDQRRVAQSLDLSERQAGANRIVLRKGASHAAAQCRDPAQQAGRDLGLDVDQNPA
ncbi:MAG: hypothetical protein OES41_06610, partial [Rhodospirillales bacterium]|nr:hypothetical protein [Rhodospirillales bacterium]